MISTVQEDPRKTMESCLEDVEEWFRPVDENYTDCKRKRDCCEDTDNKCWEMQEQFEDPRKTMESCLEDVEEWFRPVDENYTDCKRKRDCCEDKDDKCWEMQEHFEDQ